MHFLVKSTQNMVVLYNMIFLNYSPFFLFSSCSVKLPTTCCCHQCLAGPRTQPRSFNVLKYKRLSTREKKSLYFYYCKTVQIIFYLQRSCWNHDVWNCIEPGARLELASNHQHPSATNNSHTFSFFHSDFIFLKHWKWWCRFISAP